MMKPTQPLKSLNTSGGRQRFKFKRFAELVEEIETDDYHSLERIKEHPTTTTFFLDELITWRELNTAEHFISFYEKAMPMVQSLEQILIHKEKIFSELLSILNMEAKLSIEPTLRLIAALSRDILNNFLPFLQRLSDTTLKLISNGGDRDTTILEQVFKCWSSVSRNLQKYIVDDVVSFLRVTASLLFYSKDYVRECMAKVVALILRNASGKQPEGIRWSVLEVVETSSKKDLDNHKQKIDGVTALLSYSMKATPSRLHSRARSVFMFLIGKSIYNASADYPKGTEVTSQVITGIIDRLCSDIPDASQLLLDCFLKEILEHTDDNFSMHLTHVLHLVTFTVQRCSKQKKFARNNMIELLHRLVQSFVRPADGGKLEEIPEEVINNVLQFMLTLLEVPSISNDLSSILHLFAPAFKMRNSSSLPFIKGLILKDPHIGYIFKHHISSALDNAIEASPQEVLFLMLTFFERQPTVTFLHHNEMVNTRKFFEDTIDNWIKLLSDFVGKQVLLTEMATLWGVLNCYPRIQVSRNFLPSLKDLITTLDQLLVVASDEIAGLPKSMWQSLLGAALASYHEMLLKEGLENSEVFNYFCIAKRHKTSVHVMSAVDKYLDDVLSARKKVLQEFDLDLEDAISTFADNLCLSSKAIRVSTLRVLSCFAPLKRQVPTTGEPSRKKLKTEESQVNDEEFQNTNVIELLYSAETTPLSITESRKIIVIISRLHMSLSSGKIGHGYIPLLLHGLVGILHNRFGHLWEPTLECLATLIKSQNEISWNIFIHLLEDSQSEFLSSGVCSLNLQVKSAKSDTLVDCFSLFLASDVDASTPSAMVTTLLIQALKKIPFIAESRSRRLIPVFLKFLGYHSPEVKSIESYGELVCSAKEWKAILKEWLDLLKLMRNAQSLHRSHILKEILLERLLDQADPDIQLKVLDCVMNWKDEFLIPYEQHLKNLIISKNLREELTSWDISEDSEHIQVGHRNNLIPIVVRLLTPKVRKLKTLGSRKHAGVSHRRAILCFLAQLDVKQLELFFRLLLKPLFPKPLHDVSNSQKTPEEHEHRSGSPVLLKCSSTMDVSCISSKKINGFLHVVEEIFKTFDELRLRPFLSPLLMIIVRILQSCTMKISKENEHKVDACPGDLHTNDTSIMSPDSLMMSTSVRKIKELRSLCLKIISFSLNKYETHDFGSVFWDIFFSSVKPLIESFKQEGSSSEKPSSLFSCFIAMSGSNTLVRLLAREANLVPSIFSMLTVKTASEAIISSVLDFIDNLLSLDNDSGEQGDDSLKIVLVPHLDVLIHSFHTLLQSARKSAICSGKKELRIFKHLVKYVNGPHLAGQFLDILLPILRKKQVDTDKCMEALSILSTILPNLGVDSSEKILVAIHLLLTFVGLEVRLCLCNILDSLMHIDPSVAFLARLLHDLNAVSSSLEIGEMDYDTIIRAYDTITSDFFSECRVEHALVILSHCIYDMSSEEMIFRQSASRALVSFVQFASSFLSKNEKNHQEMLTDNEDNVIVDTPGNESTLQHSWTGLTIQQIVKKTILYNIGEAMHKDASIRKEWLGLLRAVIHNLQGIHYLRPFRLLCSEDRGVNFFEDIVDLPMPTRRKALSRFRDVTGLEKLPEDLIVKIFLPLFFNMMLEVKDGKGEDLRNACVDTIASLFGHLRWNSYRVFLMRCFREMTLKSDKRKILIRLICAVLDVFYHSAVSSGNPRKEDGAVITVGNISANYAFDDLAISSDVRSFMQQKVLPKIQNLLTLSPDKVNVSASLAAFKVLKMLPLDTMESNLSSVVHSICSFLKNRLESVRDEARSALVACLRELGVTYLKFVVKILQAILKRGYEMHVLGYTINYMLSDILRHSSVGKLDYCLEELLSVVENDILGDVAEEKEVDKIASKMKETRKNKSFDTLKLISKSVTFRTHAMKLLVPIKSRLLMHLTPKMKKRLQMMLDQIALGFGSNPSAEPTDLFVFVYGLVEDNLFKGAGDGKEMTNKFQSQVNGKNNAFGSVACAPQNSHLLIIFALKLLYNRLKRMKLTKEDPLLPMLDPFINLLGLCLSSKYEDVLSYAFRCLAVLAKLPLPSLEVQANKMKNLLLEIAQKSGNANSSSLQSCLKLLTVLLRNTRISLSNEQLHLLVQIPLFVDIQTNPSATALSLLKAIIREKLVVPEIYDIVVRVSELMVTTQLEPIRKRSSKILLQFLLDYHLSNKRLQQHIDFLLENLNYQYSAGKEAVLDMLHVILVKFPQSIVDDQAQTIFMHLVLALTNERDHKVQEMVSRVLKVLIKRSSKDELYSVLKYCISWYTGENQQLWSAAAQVLSLLVEDFEDGFREHIDEILVTAKGILEVSIPYVSNKEHEVSNEPRIPLWRAAYFSLTMLEKILAQFKELYLNKNIQGLWILICKLLLHRHIWVRNVCSCLVKSYFDAAFKADQLETDIYLLHPSRLFAIAASFLNQLRTNLIDDEAGNLIAENIVSSIFYLHCTAAQMETSHLDGYWSSLCSHDQDSYLEAFGLLGSRKAKDAFVITTAKASNATREKDKNEGDEKDFRSLLVIPLLRRMGKIAIQMEDKQMKIVFNCFRIISEKIGCLLYATHMLLPLYKVCEGFAGKVITDEMKHLAEGVRNSIRDKIGVETFVGCYNSLRENLKQKRDKRKQHEKLMAVVNPMQHAKRKLKIAAKHQIHKKRKIMTMKMGRWRR